MPSLKAERLFSCYMGSMAPLVHYLWVALELWPTVQWWARPSHTSWLTRVITMCGWWMPEATSNLATTYGSTLTQMLPSGTSHSRTLENMMCLRQLSLFRMRLGVIIKLSLWATLKAPPSRHTLLPLTHPGLNQEWVCLLHWLQLSFFNTLKKQLISS